MAMYGPWQDRIEALFGVTRTSGDRSNAEQQGYYDRGLTRLRGGESPHNIPDNAIDIPPVVSAAEANRRAAAAGIPVNFIYESGRGRNQGTGPHLHGQRTSGSRQVAQEETESQGRRLLAPSTERELLVEANREDPEATPDEMLGDPMESTDQHPVVNPFTVGPELRERADVVEGELAGQAAFLDRQEAEMEAVQESRRARTEEVVAEKRGILDMLQESNRELVARTAPLLQQQANVSRRMGELATMNPLERGLRGIFDLNYNQRYLTQVSNELATAIQEEGNRYQFATSLQEHYSRMIDAEHANEGELELLQIQELDEDGRMAAQGLNMAIQSFGFLGQQVEQNATVVRAQILERSNYLDGLDAGQVNALLEEANNSPDGYVEADGVRIGAGELRNRSMQWEQQQLSLRSAQLSLRANEIQLADAHARQLAGRMTEAQLQEAAANNGMYNGVQIPAEAITQGLHNYEVRRELQVNQITRQGGAAGTVDYLRNSVQGMRSVLNRARTVGPIPETFTREIVENAGQLQRLTQQLHAATEQGLGNEVSGPIQQQITALRERFNAQIETLAQRYAGNSEAGSRMMASYLRGDPINSNEATEAMVEFVDQGGLPSNMRASPTFRAVFEVTERAAREVDAQSRASGRSPSQAERQRMINQRVRQLAPARVNAANMQQLFPHIPEMATEMNHPFRGVSQEDLLRAQQTGRTEAYAAIASQLGVSPTDAQQIFAGTWRRPPGIAPAAAQQLLQRAEESRGALMATERAAFLRALDESPSASRMQVAPSRAFVDLVTSNGFYQRVARFEEAQATFSFGDSLASSMGNRGLVQTATDYGNSLRSIAQNQTIERQSSSRYAHTAYGLSPHNRTSAILGAIPELEAEDEALLIQAIQRAVPGYRGANLAQVSQVNQSIRGFIVGQRFQDPNLERVRRIAATHYDDAATRMDTAMDRMHLSQSIPIVGESLANAIYGPEQ